MTDNSNRASEHLIGAERVGVWDNWAWVVCGLNGRKMLSEEEQGRRTRWRTNEHP
jgi:hypothetical protein